jgi:hypothetical protein
LEPFSLPQAESMASVVVRKAEARPDGFSLNSFQSNKLGDREKIVGAPSIWIIEIENSFTIGMPLAN